MKISSIIPISEVNGLGPHYTIWVEGCTLKCPDCFNPHTHDLTSGMEKKISHLLQDIKKYWLKKQIIGLTLTGREPFHQINEVIQLTKQIKSQTNLGIIILTGYSPKELLRLPSIKSVTENIDLIIAGLYLREFKIQSGLRGSSNKNYLYYSDFYKKFVLDEIPLMEVIANEVGEIIISGIEPDILLDTLNPE